MAGETKGKTYEALVKVVLDRLRAKGVLTGQVFWNDRPASMTIEPDFTVGPDKDHPTHVFLVTHSGSAKDSEKKFWRNIGELAEAKVRLPTPAKVYSIAFDSTIKEDLKALQGAAFDGQLLVGEAAYGAALIEWAADAQSHLPKKGADKLEAIGEACRGGSALASPKRWLDAMARDLERLLSTTRSDLDDLWQQERARPAGRAPQAKETFLRRGVGKLLLIDDLAQVSKAGMLSKSVSADEVSMLKSLGLVGPSLAGHRVNDKEMLWALKSLTPAQLKGMHASRTNPRIAEWIDCLKNLAGVEAQLEYAHQHWGDLTNGGGLLRHLNACHANPHSLCAAAAMPGSKRVWLYHLAIEWIKLGLGTRTDFGVAALIAELKRLRTDANHQKAVRALVGRTVDWRSEETIRLGLQDWQSATSDQRFPLEVDDLARVADCLARLLAKTKKPDPVLDSKRLSDALIQTVLEAKLLTYRNFTPFEDLLHVRLKSAGMTGQMLPAVRACFAEAASAAGVQLDPRSSGTTVMRVRNTLINWQSVSDEGRDHKKKELCGRAPALRYQWDTEQGRFVRRPWAEKMMLILDGTWRQEDLDALAKAGWDGIYYPDDLDRLVVDIV